MSALGVSDEHAALAEAVRGIAAAANTVAQSRAAADAADEELPPVWPVLASQELLTLPFDAAVLDVAVAVEALGHELAPGPYLPTVLVAELVKRFGSPQQVESLTAELASGSASYAISISGAALSAASDADLLLGGAAVSHVMLPIEADGRRSWVIAPTVDLTVTSTPGIDPTRRVATVSSVRLDAPEVLDGVDDGTVRRLAAVLLAAESLGVAEWCLRTAVDYAKVREQFGRPIGSFQAVKHRCADMLCRIETARAAVWDAAEAMDEPEVHDAERELAVAVAAALGPQAAVDCAKDCIQILGGIGYTWEHDAHLYLKRALAVRQLVGDPAGWQSAAAHLAAKGVRRARSLELGPDVATAREQVRDFLNRLAAAVDGDRERRVAIADAGYLVPHWPSPYGRSAGPAEQLVIDEEFRRAGVLRPDLVIGNWALPTILQYGTDQQRERFVPPTLHGDITWCQMFSEPGAGSDLASLQTKAARISPDAAGAGGGWSLSGQKVWTSQAKVADWAICLARTSTGAKRQDGITYFLVDMTSTGIDVRPLRELTGDALFNEVFLSDVFVPDDCVVGEVGQGWRLARTTLANERVSMSGGSAFPSGIEELLQALAAGGPDDPVARQRVGTLVCLAQGDAMLGVRSTLARVSGTDPGAASSVRKLVGMHLRQDAAELSLELLGPGAVTATGDAAAALRRFLGTRALTIAGGTSEVLHNVIGERILGLAR